MLFLIKKNEKGNRKNIKNVVSKEFKNVVYDNDKNGFEIDLFNHDVDTKEITDDTVSEFKIKNSFSKEIISYLKQYNYLEEKLEKKKTLIILN